VRMEPSAQRSAPDGANYGTYGHLSSFAHAGQEMSPISETKDHTQCFSLGFFILEAFQFASLCALLSEARQHRYTETLLRLLYVTVIMAGVALLAGLPSKHSAICQRSERLLEPHRDCFITGKVLLFTSLTAPLFAISVAIFILFRHTLHSTTDLIPVICGTVFTSLEMIFFPWFCHSRLVHLDSLTSTFLSCATVDFIIGGMIYYFFVDAKQAGKVLGCLVGVGVLLSLCNHCVGRRKSGDEDSRDSF